MYFSIFYKVLMLHILRFLGLLYLFSLKAEHAGVNLYMSMLVSMTSSKTDAGWLQQVLSQCACRSIQLVEISDGVTRHITYFYYTYIVRILICIK